MMLYKPIHNLLSTLLLLLHTATALPQWNSWSSPTCPPSEPGYNVDLVIDLAEQLSTHSWEFGTCAETLLELYSPSFAVFSPSALPSSSIPSAPRTLPALAYAAPHIRLDNTTLVDGDGANGDPASLGVSAILLATSSFAYSAAIHQQAAHILAAPRLSNGAISHRDTSPQAWADFIYMAPPFLAYYAVSTDDVPLMRETVRQCGLYRALLQVSPQPPHTFWRHILDERAAGATDHSLNDTGAWSTGNGWAAMGMARVLGTIAAWSDKRGELAAERAQLTGWVAEIVDGARAAGTESGSGLLRNYLDNATWFGETSGSALLAATVYRMAVLEPESVFGRDRGYVEWAEGLRESVARHVTGNGTLSPAVNPLDWFDLTPWTAGSPEGQSFGGMLAAAYRDWKCVSGEGT